MSVGAYIRRVTEALQVKKHTNAGVRGAKTSGLRDILARIDTTGSGTVLTGEGFTFTRSGVGHLVVTFDPPYAETPAVAAQAEVPSLGGLFRGVEVYNPTATGVELRRKLIDTSLGSTTMEDGVIAFQVQGKGL